MNEDLNVKQSDKETLRNKQVMIKKQEIKRKERKIVERREQKRKMMNQMMN